MNDDARPIVKSTTEAREAVTGHNVRYVLMISLAGTAHRPGGVVVLLLRLMQAPGPSPAKMRSPCTIPGGGPPCPP